LRPGLAYNTWQMKNQYFGDINDYRKYGLLRVLSGGGQLKMGICWMLTADDGDGGGNLTTYLQKPELWRFYDPPLFDQLKKWVEGERKRSVSLIQNRDVIPGSLFFSDLLEDPLEKRAIYFHRMREKLKAADLIFYDPDNGIETSSIPRGRKGSSKYLYWDELYDLYSSDKSVLVYQHFPRLERNPYIDRRKSEICQNTGAAKVYALRTPQVVYFLAPQAQHSEYLSGRLEKVVEIWGVSQQIHIF
jgi:hypothetical protein